MSKVSFFLTLAVAIFLTSLTSFAQTQAWIKVDPASEVETPLSFESGLFSTDNAYVRLKSDVNFKKVRVVVSPTMDANEVIKALVLVFTLKMNNSADISVHIEGVDTAAAWKTSTLASLFKTAGAKSMIDQDGVNLIKKSTPKSSSLATAGQFVTTMNHEELAGNMNKIMGVPTLESNKQVKNSRIFLVAPSPEPVSESLLLVLTRMQQLKKLGAAEVHLVTPYLPYSRSDKKDIDGTAVTGRLIAKLFESSGASTVTFVRAHAPQAEGWFDIPTRNVSGRVTIVNYLKSLGVDVVVSPDAGFQKDATLYAEELALPISIINKQRDPITTETKIVGISGTQQLKGKTVVIVDDETASGGTLAKAADYLKTLGVEKVIAVVSHLSGSAKSALESKNVDLLVATNTLPVKIIHPKLRILDISAELSASLKPMNIQNHAYSCQGLF